MSLLKRRVMAALAVVGVASLVTFLQVECVSYETEDQIGTEAVWNAPDEDLTDISKVCKSPLSADYAKCFVEQMGGYASSDAVAFTQLMIAQKPSRVGYLDGMREAGLVDLGYVVYPGAKSKQGWVLMNGVPALINVDNLAQLPQSEMVKDSQFAELHKNHPLVQLAVTDDQRSADASLQIELASRWRRADHHLLCSSGNFIMTAPAFVHAIFGFDFDSGWTIQGHKVH